MPTENLRLLILGASGRLGRALVRHCGDRHTLLTPSHGAVDLQRSGDLSKALRGMEFDAVINTAGITSPEVCETDAEAAFAANAVAPGVIAEACAARGARFIHISTDYVFPGDGDQPLAESDPTGPVNVYGRSKLAGEQAVLAAMPSALVARVSWLFGPGKPSFPDQVLAQASADLPVRAINDKWSTPTSTDDLAAWLDALITEHAEIHGVLHLCNSGIATWREYAQGVIDIAADLGLLKQRQEVAGRSMIGFPAFKAIRPVFTPMSNERFTQMTGIMPDPWQAALRRSLQGPKTI